MGSLNKFFSRILFLAILSTLQFSLTWLNGNTRKVILDTLYLVIHRVLVQNSQGQWQSISFRLLSVMMY